MAETERHDILIVPENRSQSLTEGQARSLVLFMAGKGFVTIDDEAIAKTWAELYLGPGPSAHTIFVTGTNERPLPVFQRGILRFGDAAVPLPFGEQSEARLLLLFEGCAYEQVPGLFRRQLKDVAYMRAQVFTRPHAPDAVWAAKTVPDDERPADRPKRKGPPGGAVGTRVEEV
jgi:hypothetical protein